MEIFGFELVYSGNIFSVIFKGLFLLFQDFEILSFFKIARIFLVFVCLTDLIEKPVLR